MSCVASPLIHYPISVNKLKSGLKKQENFVLVKVHVMRYETKYSVHSGGWAADTGVGMTRIHMSHSGQECNTKS